MKLKLQKGFDLNLELDGKEYIFKIYITPQDKLKLQKLADKVGKIRNSLDDDSSTITVNKALKDIVQVYEDSLSVVFGDRKGELDSFLYHDGAMDISLVEGIIYPIMDKSAGASLHEYSYVTDSDIELN